MELEDGDDDGEGQCFDAPDFVRALESVWVLFMVLQSICSMLFMAFQGPGAGTEEEKVLVLRGV